MAQIGVKCPRGLIKHDECRRCSQDPLRPCHLTPDLLEALREDPDDRHADPDAFSPSGLLGCDRHHALTYGADWYVDIKSGYKMLRGTLIHHAIAAYTYPGAVGVIREQEMEHPIETSYGTQRMTGQPDIIVVRELIEAEGAAVAKVKLIDYKSTGKIGHDLVRAKTDHVRQVNMYAWLVRRWLESHYKTKMVVDIEEIEVQYLDFDKARRFTSAGPLTDTGKRLTRNPDTYDILHLEPIHIFPDAVVERGIRRMIENKLSARENLPPAIEPWEEDYWKCYSCPVKVRCGELAEAGL